MGLHKDMVLDEHREEDKIIGEEFKVIKEGINVGLGEGGGDNE
jgi:hypothetical protein